MDNQKWTIVPNGKRKKRGVVIKSSIIVQNIVSLLSVDDAYDRLVNVRKLLKASSVWIACVNFLSECPVSCIVALGIGRLVTMSTNSSWQCALLLLLKESSSCLDIKYFEPLVDVDDLELMKRFGLENDNQNEKGLIFRLIEAKLSVNEGKVLIYMPHCPYRLYCNIIWSFWGNLDRLLLIGNSFAAYELRRSLLSSPPQSDSTDSVKLITHLMIEQSMDVAADRDKQPAIEAAFCEMRYYNSIMQIDPSKMDEAIHLQHSHPRPSLDLLLAATDTDPEVL